MLDLYDKLQTAEFAKEAVQLYHAFYHRSEWKGLDHWADIDPTPWEELLDEKQERETPRAES